MSPATLVPATPNRLSSKRSDHLPGTQRFSRFAGRRSCPCRSGPRGAVVSARGDRQARRPGCGNDRATGPPLPQAPRNRALAPIVWPAVSDEPGISSLTGAVSWSASATGELVQRIPALAGELAAWSGHLPVLRLPFAADGTPPEGFATAVTLPLRDEAAGVGRRGMCAPARRWRGAGGGRGAGRPRP
jgi:hypothetical protein